MKPSYEHGGVTLYTGNSLELLRELPSESVQCCVTSPPYYALRDYGTGVWIGGDPACGHLMPLPGGTQASGLWTGNSQDAIERKVGVRRQQYPNQCPCGAERIEPTVWGGDPACAHVWTTERTYKPGSSAAVRSSEAFAARGLQNAERVKAARWYEHAFCSSCGAWRGQLGREPSVGAFVDHLCDVFDEVKRVLKKDGTCWINIGDSYAGAGYSNHKNTGGAQREQGGKQQHTVIPDARSKALLGVPWRLAFALQDRGWLLRCDVIWHKPNPMPDSVKDRPTRAHEYVFLLTKSGRYFYDSAAIREPNSPGSFKRFKPGEAIPSRKKFGGSDRATPKFLAGQVFQPNGRNRRSVWTISTESFSEAHFATFPQKLAEPCILAGSRPGDLVLDPFSGAGTVAVVARRLGRKAIGIDLKAEYNEMAARRLAQDVLPLEVSA